MGAHFSGSDRSTADQASRRTEVHPIRAYRSLGETTSANAFPGGHNPIVPDDPRITAPTTRADWERLADATLAAVRPYASPSHALIDLPGPASRSGRWSDGLEGFARTFLLAGFRLAGATAAGSKPGEPEFDELAEWYSAGLVAGTDPDSPDRWPTFTEVRQAKVEGASVAIALHESRPWIWDRLDDGAHQRIVTWLATILTDEIWDNNWTWFQAVMEAFLRSVGGPWLPEDIQRTLERTEQWYLGGGWYSDGTRNSGSLRNFDYYGGWAMHFYPLWYCRISGDDVEPGLLETYRERVREYLADAQHLVGANGAPVFQGRSLTYRFAVLAPFWAGAAFDATPLSPGATRRLANRMVGHFADHGGWDTDGLLSLGWHHAFPTIRQLYSGPGSPYWASKGFAGLVLPPEHPVWTAPEEDLPIERGDVERTFAVPGWVVSGTAADGIVRVAAHGPDHSSPTRPSADVPEYARHGFSTHALPDYELTAPLDSHIALVTADGRVSHRRPVADTRVSGRVATSRSRAHWLRTEPPVPFSSEGGEEWDLGPWLSTASLLHGPWEVRLARFDAVGDGSPDPAPLRLRIGGWAVAGAEPPATETAGPVARCSRADGLTSVVRGLAGLERGGCTETGGLNPLGAYAGIPWVTTDGPAEYGRIYAALVVLTGVPVPDQVSLEIAGDTVTVIWPDGVRDEVDLPG
jgi:hypothetical protein